MGGSGRGRGAKSIPSRPDASRHRSFDRKTVLMSSPYATNNHLAPLLLRREVGVLGYLL